MLRRFTSLSAAADVLPDRPAGLAPGRPEVLGRDRGPERRRGRVDQDRPADRDRLVSEAAPARAALQLLHEARER